MKRMLLCVTVTSMAAIVDCKAPPHAVGDVAAPFDAATQTGIPQTMGTVAFVPLDAAVAMDASVPMDASKPMDASTKHAQTTATPTARPRPFVNGDVALSPDRQ